MENTQLQKTSWTFLTNHSHVLLCLASDCSMKMRKIAQEIGITERAVQRIIADLEKAGYLTREKTGRRNSYRINTQMHLRHRVEGTRTIADLIALGQGYNPAEPGEEDSTQNQLTDQEGEK